MDEALRLPEEYRKSLLSFKERREVLRTMRRGNLSTVCEEARCPNIGECFSNKTATFMIMGDRCTRRCKFCSVTTKRPLALDHQEPEKLVQAAKDMGLDYVVVTSVDRDDLKDYGASHFNKVVSALKAGISKVKVELLTPDFKGNKNSIDTVLASSPDVFGHNIESVNRLYKSLRPQSDFTISKEVLYYVAKKNSCIVKSGMMVGVGETDSEVLDTLSLLKDIGVNIVTIGQYLRPSKNHWPVNRYVTQSSFEKFIAHGKDIGLRYIFAGPFVRSSYHAKETHVQAL